MVFQNPVPVNVYADAVADAAAAADATAAPAATAEEQAGTQNDPDASGAGVGAAESADSAPQDGLQVEPATGELDAVLPAEEDMQVDDGLKAGSTSGGSSGAGAPDHVDTEAADERRAAIIP